MRQTFRGEVEGEILLAARGPGGFGYDPLFYYPPFGCSFGEVDGPKKFDVSHRGKALARVAEISRLTLIFVMPFIHARAAVGREILRIRRAGHDLEDRILAGVTTFMTMAYIIFVNPSILHEAGMPSPACYCRDVPGGRAGQLLMGAFARYPIALAPGMGLNAYFTYSVVKGMGMSTGTSRSARSSCPASLS